MGTEQLLEGAFGAAAPDHYRWQTTSPYVAERERELVRAAFLPLGERVLDLGCAEGATLFHLEADGATGVDLFEDKLAFAKKALPGCRFVKGSAYELPFDDSSFDHVIIRDVIHHIDTPERALAEVARVVAKGGRIDILEPCRNNPLILIHALTKPEERGELRSTERFLASLLEPHCRIDRALHLQALPIHRLVLHPQMGRPSWGKHPWISSALSAVEGAAERVLPRAAWAYVHVRGVRA